MQLNVEPVSILLDMPCSHYVFRSGFHTFPL